MRMLVIKQDTDLQALSGRLLTAKLSARQTDSAVESLQALNPHVDLKNLRSGTVLLVPDTPSFKVSATDAVHGGSLHDFQQQVRAGLAGAVESLKAGNARRSAERADVAAAFGTRGLKRILESDVELKQQVADVTNAFKKDQQEADQAEQTLAAASKAALAALAALSKVLG